MTRHHDQLPKERECETTQYPPQICPTTGIFFILLNE